jgi:hypothetical protein
LRTLLAILVFCLSLWITIEAFGAVVTGEMNVLVTKVKRDAGAVFFWFVVSAVHVLCLAGLLLAAALLFNIV